MLATLIFWSTLPAWTPCARAQPGDDRRAATHAARDVILHERVTDLLKSPALRLMLFRTEAPSADDVEYWLDVHPAVPTDLAAHFVITLARLEKTFAERASLDPAALRREVDLLLALATLGLRARDDADVTGLFATRSVTLGAGVAAAFNASVRALEAPRLLRPAPRVSASFFTNLAAHFDRALAAARTAGERTGDARVTAWVNHAWSAPIEAPVRLETAPVPAVPKPTPDADTLKLLRDTLGFNGCAGALEAGADAGGDAPAEPSAP